MYNKIIPRATQEYIYRLLYKFIKNELNSPFIVQLEAIGNRLYERLPNKSNLALNNTLVICRGDFDSICLLACTRYLQVLLFNKYKQTFHLTVQVPSSEVRTPVISNNIKNAFSALELYCDDDAVDLIIPTHFEKLRFFGNPPLWEEQEVQRGSTIKLSSTEFASSILSCLSRNTNILMLGSTPTDNSLEYIAKNICICTGIEIQLFEIFEGIKDTFKDELSLLKGFLNVKIS